MQRSTVRWASISGALSVVLTFAAVLPSRAQAPEATEGTSSQDSGEAHAGQLSALLFISPDPDGFLEQWQKPEQPGFVPQLTTTSRLGRGDKVAAFLLFRGCRPDESGNCDLSADFRVLKPDQSDYANHEGMEVWRGKHAPPEGNLQLAVSNLMIRIEPKDPLGEYSVNVVVHDRIAHVDGRLSRRFVVTSDQNVSSGKGILPGSIDSGEDLNSFLTLYYRAPDPELVASAIATLGKERTLDHEGAAGPALGFFTYVFAANKARIQEWTAMIDRQEKPTRDVLKRAVAFAEDPETLFRGESPSPSLNDVRWGAFFATGDTSHVAALIRLLDQMGERKNLTLFLAAASAKWSLASNARMHPLVKTSLEAARLQVSTQVRAEIEEVLTRSPAEIQASMRDVLRAQHASGVW